MNEENEWKMILSKINSSNLLALRATKMNKTKNE